MKLGYIPINEELFNYIHYRFLGSDLGFHEGRVEECKCIQLDKGAALR